ncbi:sugar transferase [Nonomuraea terrae]|uniref:Sugar transferase n=1 Tax=Nonomuraea terrae TaxID=2530383 RepID=A0A4R4ZGV8_9ACTN|nr:sugar transferase [Nonomuraea terrae]TDD57276.1 sugar transferase [Nonomuraea terrae]
MAVRVGGDRQVRRQVVHRRPRMAVQPLGLAGIDLICMAFTAAVAGQEALRIGLAAVLVVAFGCVGHVYAARILPSTLDRGFWLTGAGAAAALAAFWPATLTVVGLSAALFTVCALCLRSVLYFLVRRARMNGRSAPAVVIGAGPHAHKLAATLLAHPEYGLLPLGFLDEAAGDRPLLPVLGGPADTGAVIRAHDVRAVVVTGQGHPSVARTARALGCQVFLAPEPGEPVADFVSLREHVRGFPLVRMRAEAQHSLAWPLKRAIDVALALTGLIVSAPILAVCALLVRWETGPGLLFKQRRVGYLGEPIELVKLRTLKPVDAHESETLWSIAHDARVGPVGRMLRRTSFDELPQLWNVLKGDMSVIGPRPERPYFVEEFSRTVPGYELRHRMPVGITGWAQIHGLRGDTSIEDRARFDNHYIDGWSLRTDLKIILLTVWSMLRPGGS